MLSVVSLGALMMLQSCNYIKEELRNDPVDRVESVECVECDNVEINSESREGVLDVNIDRGFISESPLTYQVKRANGHDYMIFVSVYGVAAVHDPDCSCGHAHN